MWLKIELAYELCEKNRHIKTYDSQNFLAIRLAGFKIKVLNAV